MNLGPKQRYCCSQRSRKVIIGQVPIMSGVLAVTVTPFRRQRGRQSVLDVILQSRRLVPG
jgi:hypothetical protein